MSRVRTEWFGDAFLAKVQAAAEGSLDDTADALRSNIVLTLDQTTGKEIGGDPRKRNVYKASLPGTPPGSRSGMLRNLMTATRSGPLKRRVGTNLKYARIHELGGTINHPGGTYYTIGAGGKAFFLKAERAQQLASQGRFVGRTKPHTINMPKRPYMVPTLERMAQTGELSAVFNAGFRQRMAGGGA